MESRCKLRELCQKTEAGGATYQQVVPAINACLVRVRWMQGESGAVQCTTTAPFGLMILRVMVVMPTGIEGKERGGVVVVFGVGS